MKKILSLSLVVVLLTAIFTLPVSAAGNQAAVDLYRTSTLAMDGVRSMETSISGTVSLGMSGTTVDTSFGGDMQQYVHSKTDMDLAINMDLAVAGQTVNTKMYYTNGTMYMNAMGQKIAMPLDIKQAMEMAYSIDLTGFDKDILDTATMTTVLGGTEISFTVSADTMNAMMGSAMTSAMQGVSLSSKDSMKLTDMKYTMMIGQDNIVKKVRMVYGADTTINGQKATMKYDMTVETLSINKLSGIKFPDFSTYKVAADLVAPVTK